MKITDIDKLNVGDQFSYRGHPAVVSWKREKDDSLAVGSEPIDKSVCISFVPYFGETASSPVTLVSRIDSKMAVDGFLFELDLPDYQPDQLIDIFEK